MESGIDTNGKKDCFVVVASEGGCSYPFKLFNEWRVWFMVCHDHAAGSIAVDVYNPKRMGEKHMNSLVNADILLGKLD